MQLHKSFHPTRAPSRHLPFVKRDPARSGLRLKLFLQGFRNIQIHPHEMNIVQSFIVVIPSLLTHFRIFVARCHAEDHDMLVEIVIEYLLKCFYCRYRDDFMRLEGSRSVRDRGVVAVRFGCGDGICYCFEMHFNDFPNDAGAVAPSRTMSKRVIISCCSVGDFLQTIYIGKCGGNNIQKRKSFHDDDNKVWLVVNYFGRCIHHTTLNVA